MFKLSAIIQLAMAGESYFEVGFDRTNNVVMDESFTKEWFNGLQPGHKVMLEFKGMSATIREEDVPTKIQLVRYSQWKEYMLDVPTYGKEPNLPDTFFFHDDGEDVPTSILMASYMRSGNQLVQDYIRKITGIFTSSYLNNY